MCTTAPAGEEISTAFMCHHVIQEREGAQGWAGEVERGREEEIYCSNITY